jgi:hypothetical protein
MFGITINIPNKKKDIPAMNEFPKKGKHERASRSNGKISGDLNIPLRFMISGSEFRSQYRIHSEDLFLENENQQISLCTMNLGISRAPANFRGKIPKVHRKCQPSWDRHDAAGICFQHGT